MDTQRISRTYEYDLSIHSIYIISIFILFLLDTKDTYLQFLTGNKQPY